MKRFFLVVAILISLAAKAQSPEWVYKPVSISFWTDVESALAKGKYSDVVHMGDSLVKESGKDNLSSAEGSLAVAIGMSKLGLTYAATILLSDIVKTKPGTHLSERALLEIQDIIQRAPVDEEMLYPELIYDLDASFENPQNRDFINFQNGFYNSVKGFDKWSDDDFKKITPGSYWDYRLKYIGAIQEVQKDHLDSAIERFASLASNPQVPENLRTEATHQYGRLVFEKGDYAQAYKILRSVVLNPRERGLILLERAWAKYYMKDYSKALGLLTALEAPIFDTARSPETYLLKMLIYKDLCYYDSALTVQGEFMNRFSNSLKVIRSRGDLTKDPMIVNLAVLDPRLGRSVAFLNEIKDERVSFSKMGFGKLNLVRTILRQFAFKQREMYQRLDWALEKKSREIAEDLISWQEQISFLDYQTRVDSLRVTRPTGEVDYKSEEIPHMSFDKVYWIFTGEFWLDELENLKVQVQSKCQFSNSGESQ